MGCINNIVKYVLIAINGFYSLIAILLIACGGIILYLENDVPGDNTELLFIPIIITVCGCLLFLITLFGCCGPIAEKTFLLVVGIIFMVILLSGKVYLAVQIRTDLFVNLIEDFLSNMFKDSSTRETFLLIESVFVCCGTTGPDSYENINVTLPITCCPLNIPELTDIAQLEELCAKEDAYTGCTKILINLFSSVLNGLYYAVIALIVIEAVGVILAFYLIYDIRKTRKLSSDGKEPEQHPRTTIRNERFDEAPQIHSLSQTQIFRGYHRPHNGYGRPEWDMR